VRTSSLIIVVNLVAATAGANSNPIGPPPPWCPITPSVGFCQEARLQSCPNFPTACPYLIENAFDADNQANPNARLALAPPTTHHAGQVTSTKYTAFDPVASNLQLIGATDGYRGSALNHRAWVQNPNLNGTRSRWIWGKLPPPYVDPESFFRGDGTRSSSCDEYAYKRYTTMSAYEDFVAGVNPLDYMALFRGLYQTAFIYRNEVDDEQGGFVMSWSLPPHAKSIYFELPISDLPLRTYSFNPANVRALSVVGTGPSPEIPTTPDQLYGFVSNLINQYGTDVLEQHYQDEKQFRELMHKRARVVDLDAWFSRQSICWLAPAVCQQVHAEFVQGIYQIDEQLDQMLTAALWSGCLVTNGPTACDLSPHQLVDEVHAAIDAQREPDHQACMKITGNHFGAGSFLDNVNRGGLAGFGIPAGDYAANTGSLKGLLDTVGQRVNAVQLPIDPATGKYTLGDEKSDYQSWGSDWFGADYSYDAAWHVTDLAAPNLICNANLHLKSLLTVNGTILSNNVGVVDFAALVDTAGTNSSNNTVRAQTHFKLLGSDVYSPVDQTTPLDFSIALGGIDSGEKNIWSSPPIVIPIGPIDVNITGGIAGGVGVDGSLTGGLGRNCNPDVNTINLQANSSLQPFAHLEGFAQAALGVPSVLEVGVRGSVTLVRAGLPFNAGLQMALNGNGAVTLTGTSSLSLDLTTFGGNIAVFLDSLFGSTEKELISWKGLEMTQKLFELDFTTPVAVSLVQLKLGQSPGTAL
jgi:hypothetical protein